PRGVAPPRARRSRTFPPGLAPRGRCRHARHPRATPAQDVDGPPIPQCLHGRRPTAVGRCRTLASHAAYRSGRTLIARRMEKGPHAASPIRNLLNPTRGRRLIPAGRLAAGALALAFMAGGVAQASSFGHARLVSGSGEPLLILVPISGLTDADLQALSARPAPAPDWAQAGLTPPVPLDSLSVSVGPDVRPGGRRILRVGSSQAFSGNLADLLLDVRTATGEQRYQVSLVAPGPARNAA